MKVRKLTMQRLAGIWIAVVMAPAVLAVDESGMDGLPEYEPGREWEEQAARLPAYPSGDDLVALDTDYPGYRYFIDPASVSVGKKDQVARYTVIIESTDGVRNVFYEGMRCDSRQYKTYAYGSADGPFHEMPDAGWKYIRSEAAFRYRRDLVDFYVCDGPIVRFDAKEIVKQIKYPPSVRDSDYVP